MEVDEDEDVRELAKTTLASLQGKNLSSESTGDFTPATTSLSQDGAVTGSFGSAGSSNSLADPAPAGASCDIGSHESAISPFQLCAEDHPCTYDDDGLSATL